MGKHFPMLPLSLFSDHVYVKAHSRNNSMSEFCYAHVHRLCVMHDDHLHCFDFGGLLMCTSLPGFHCMYAAHVQQRQRLLFALLNKAVYQLRVTVL